MEAAVEPGDDLAGVDVRQCGKALRVQPLEKDARRRGSALSSRTAPSPPQRRSARCSCSDSASEELIFRTAGPPSDVRTGNTIEPDPWIGSPSRRSFHCSNWLCVTLARLVTVEIYPRDAMAADSAKPRTGARVNGK